MSKELKNGRHEDEAGTIKWYQCDILHREEGPAVEYLDGSKEWWLSGKLNRVEWSNGAKFWYKDDEFHREDGPAIVYSNNEKEWYLNDVKLTEAEFNERTAILLEVTPTQKRVKI